MIPLEQIVPDPEFVNLRLPPSDEEVELRADSMRREGIKVPLILIESLIPPAGELPLYHVRAGFRRELAARRLKWKAVPTIVLPPGTPVVDEYWTNIVENASRSKLSSYEVARAAKIMRDKFKTTPRDFAVRAGYSESYVVNLLRSLDQLPPEIVEVWKDQAPIPVDLYVKWSSLSHQEALQAMQTYTGRNPKVVRDWRPPPEVQAKLRTIKLASTAGLARMQRLRFAVEAARELSERERDLCLRVVDYCSGARDDVPQVYSPEDEKKSKKTEEKRELVAELTPEKPEEGATSLTLQELEDDRA
jgi:ParB/RepB/Spo0J family partition protein